MKIRTLLWVGLLCAPAGLFAQEEKRLTLIDALKAAVEQNLEVQLQKLNVDTSNLNLDQTKAVYEPVVTSNLKTENETSPATSRIDGDQPYLDKTRTFGATFSKTEDFGMNYSVTFQSQKITSGSDNRPPLYYTSYIGFNVEQKLLKGFDLHLDSEILRKDQFIAIANRDISESEWLTRIMDVLQRTENAYWDLVNANEQLKVAQQSLELANQLYHQNKVKIEVGTMAPIELVNTEAAVAQREKDIVDAENAVKAAEDQLKKVMNLPPAQWGTHFVPTEEAKWSEIKVNLNDDLHAAFKNRPEMKKQALERRRAELEHKTARNQLLPELTFGANYNAIGADFTAEGELPGSIEEASYGDALDQALNRELPGYGLELKLRWLPFNKQAKIALSKSEVSLRQVELQTKQAELDVTEQVRSAVRELESVGKAVKASEKNLRFREESLKAEEQKFQNGLSTNYRVAEEQELLTRAKSELITAKVRYQKAVVSYYKALGKLTEERGIQVQ